MEQVDRLRIIAAVHKELPDLNAEQVLKELHFITQNIPAVVWTVKSVGGKCINRLFEQLHPHNICISIQSIEKHKIQVHFFK